MRDPDEDAVRQIYCENCGAFKPLVESGFEESDVHYYELTCGVCSRLIAIVQVSASNAELRYAPAQCP